MDLTKYYPDIAAKYPAYVTQRELCEICHICPKTAYNLEQQGEIPYTIEQNHLIRSHKIKLTDILAYLYRRECRQEADSPYICAMRTFYDEHLSPYCAYAASCGVIPLAPHTIFTQYLNDAVPEQREQGLRMGHELLERCDELWVMGDTISQGMKDEIGLATFLQLPILYVSDDMVKNQTMIRQSDRPLDINDCIPDSSQYNYENQFLVLKPGVSSKGEDMTADDSIWYARNGFGCIYGARGQAVYAESLLTGKYIHWERHDFCGIVKSESLKEWLLDKPVRNEAAEELTKFVTPELISAAKQNHTACGYPFLIGYAPAEGGLHEAFCLDPDPVNLASFIVKMGKERGDLMICTPLDTPFLNTFGTFIDRCEDQDFLQKHLLPVLVPMQMGETEPQEIKLTEDQDNEAFLDDFAVEDDMEL